MLELKIQCDCGQKYKFDVEPVSGRMPFTVQCPVCKLDGTAKANEKLQHLASAQPMRITLSGAGAAPTAAPAASVPPAIAPAAIAPAPPMPPPVPQAPRVRLSGPAHAAAPAPVPATAPAPAPVAVAAAAPMGVLIETPPEPAPAAPVHGRPMHAPLASAVLQPTTKPSFGMGLLGALVGTLVGALVYFAVFHFFGLRFKLLAVGVGYLSGLGAELLSRKEGSKELGLLAATFSLVGLVCAQYFVVKLNWNKESAEEMVTYEAAVAEAKQIMTSMPTGSDQEIRVYLAQEVADEGEKPAPEEISAEEIKVFKELLLPRIQDLASGKITKEEYEKEESPEPVDLAEQKKEDEETFKDVFLLFLLSKFNLFSMAGAAGLAYKVCANA